MSDYGLNPLTILSELQHPVADLVRDYLATKHDWKVDNWFLRRTNALFQAERLPLGDLPALDGVSFEINRSMANNVRLLSIHPHFFRGFRRVESVIDVSGDLVVIDGRNSSGKTSLAEAIEWVLTGHLIRRELGDPKELSECIANKFKPADEETWVECAVELNDEVFTLKRCLVTDYDSTKNSRCEWRFYVNGREETEPSEILNLLFGGVPPLLMQHTLRKFVLDNPIERRNYFERLLNLDDITSVIQKAVIGDVGRGHFSRPGGGKTLKIWQELEKSVNRTDASMFNLLDKADSESISSVICRRLHRIGVEEFSLESDLTLESMVERLQEFQRSARQGKFSPLEKLRPQRTLDQEAQSQLSGEKNTLKTTELVEALQTYNTALNSTKHLSEAQEVISKAVHALRLSGLIQDVEQDQICPICKYREIPTLSKRRVQEVLDWIELGEVMTKAIKKRDTEFVAMAKIVNNLKGLRKRLIPEIMSQSEWDSATALQIEDALERLKNQHEESNESLSRFDELTSELFRKLKSKDDSENIESKLKEIFSLSGVLISSARAYATAFSEFEDTLDKLASTDQIYTARKYWIEVWNTSDELVADLRWENAKVLAQGELERLRTMLIEYRQNYLEARRQDFSNGINEIWLKLREDRYSVFKEIAIPQPKGRGFPVKFEVKALLDDSSRKLEIDALNVLSESQINVIGIASFITRSRLIGHGCLFLDDPVQSMDDEHFRAFANELLNYLCDLGVQTILLTHNDLFARDVSHFHYDRSNYRTMKIRHSRRQGVVVEEGNRRVSERLKIAERLAEEGKLDRAWYYVRIAIERLYTVVQLKHGSEGFDARSWANHTLEEMWNTGIDKIFERFAPGSGTRLKAILKMALTGGHDKAESGFTDLIRAIKYIRPLLTQLKVGG
ncbi:MAG: AAA family ATPase [Chloroflexota bacterium]|nr:AAA family ATPase [Chloroflexota bacterium]